MRAVPNTIVRMAEPTAAISNARAKGSVPCSYRKVTSTLRVFCSMNTINATETSAAAQMPAQAALHRVRGTARWRVVTGACAGSGASVGSATGGSPSACVPRNSTRLEHGIGD